MADVLSFASKVASKIEQPTKSFEESERDAILAVVDRIKRADERNQASRSPVRAVSAVEKTFQEDANLPVEFFDFFKIEKQA